MFVFVFILWQKTRKDDDDMTEVTRDKDLEPVWPEAVLLADPSWCCCVRTTSWRSSADLNTLTLYPASPDFLLCCGHYNYDHQRSPPDRRLQFVCKKFLSQSTNKWGAVRRAELFSQEHQQNRRSSWRCFLITPSNINTERRLVGSVIRNISASLLQSLRSCLNEYPGSGTDPGPSRCTFVNN